jgi:hypothetical protein
MKMNLIYRAAPVFICLFLLAGLSSCSSQETTKAPKSKLADKTLSFYEDEDGKDVHYQVSFDKKNRITSLEVDGKEIPPGEYKNYQDLVYSKINEIGDISPKRKRMLYRFDTDIDSLIIPDLSELPKIRHFKFRDFRDSTFTDDLKDHYIFRNWDDSTWQSDMNSRHYIFKGWDDSTFREGVKNMKEEMAKLKDVKVRIKFDKDKFSKEMEILRKELSDMNINEDLRNLNEDIRKMTEELRNKKIVIDDIKVDIPEIEVEIKNLDRKKLNLDRELSELRKELNKLEGFMNDMRKELRKDGIIKSEDEDFSIRVRSGKIIVNDEEIPSEKAAKYREIYRKNFGKELKESERFEIN